MLQRSTDFYLFYPMGKCTNYLHSLNVGIPLEHLVLIKIVTAFMAFFLGEGKIITWSIF